MVPTRANVNPRVLRWAREAAGFNLEAVAAKLQKQPSDVQAWEQGTARPTVRQARALANAYKRPFATFFLREPPPDPLMLPDFRRVSSDRARSYSPDLRLAIRTARYRQLWLRERLVETEQPKLRFVGSWKEPRRASELAATIRAKLRADSRVPAKTPKPEAFRTWVDAAEEAGIAVMQGWTFEPTEARGFALPDAYAPFVYINTRDTDGARIFSLIHELAHIWLGAPGVSDAGVGRGAYPPGAKRIEEFCNKVAAEVLVPAARFDELLRTVPPKESPADTARAMARHFSVGDEVIARRLLDRGRITQREYEQLRTLYIEAWKRRTAKKPDTVGGLPTGLRVVTQVGARFAGAVTGALGAGEVSARDATLLLNMDLSKIPDLEKQLRGTRSRRRTG